MLKLILRLGFLSFVLTMSVGAKCGGGGVSTAEKLCGDTGGTWDDGKCPKACWPLACGESPDEACSTECGKEAVCKCPASAPFWKDGQGCWSKAECDKSCQG